MSSVTNAARGEPADRHAQSVAEVLAAAARASVRKGDLATAHARLTECFSSLYQAPSGLPAAAAFEAAAELALAVEEHEAAVEFFGAAERMTRERGGPAEPESSGERSRALARLREVLGPRRFEAAQSIPRATPFPLEFYASKAIDWLPGVESRLRGTFAGPHDGRPAPKPRADAGSGTTAILVDRASDGSTSAMGQLAARYLGPLRRFGHGRLPARARDLMDTDDLVQVTVVRGLGKLDRLRPVKRGGFFAYLRAILVNRVRDEIRRSERRPRVEALGESVPSALPSPMEDVIGRETAAAYRSALEQLAPRTRRALVLRIENGRSYEEVARAIRCPSANAARMLVSRALAQVQKSLSDRG